MNLAVEIADERWLQIADIEAVVEALAAACLAAGDNREISVLLANDKEQQMLNKQWRGLDKTTNVLSFPAAVPPGLPASEAPPLGDVVLAFETVAREAEAGGRTLLAHASHLIVHGILHLLGYDHGSDADADKMEARERDILNHFGITDPYQS
jgi:probable rRNA maturation factor